MVNSQNKGRVFEREITNLLNHCTKTAWHRVPCSGALSEDCGAWSGDVYTTEEKYKDVVIECKHYKRLTINHLFLMSSILHKAIKQSREESKGQPWILFIKSNNQGILMLHESFHNAILEELVRSIPQHALPCALGTVNVNKVMLP